jgi:hypothetical protein
MMMCIGFENAVFTAGLIELNIFNFSWYIFFRFERIKSILKSI